MLLKENVKPAYKKLEEKRLEIVAPVNELKSKLQGMFKPDLDKYKKAENIIKAALGVWDDEQERIRAEQQEKLRLKAVAEEEKRKKTLLEQSKKACEKGNLEKAESLAQSAAEHHVPVPIIPQAPKQQGMSRSTTWKARVTNITRVPYEYLEPNIKKLNRMAAASEGNLQIPGVECYPVKSYSVRSL